MFVNKHSHVRCERHRVDLAASRHPPLPELTDGMARSAARLLWNNSRARRHLDHLGYAGYGGFWCLIERGLLTFGKLVDRDGGVWRPGMGTEVRLPVNPQPLTHHPV